MSAAASAFAPGHISGFFSVFDSHPNPLRRGSRGGGVCISKGAWSKVRMEEGHGRIEITINGEESAAPVTRL
ncbi:MAG: hypothetical protein QCI38_08045, partial [Candidatus Thermoplasmatota archaeon]|nr:hypothetical protein [Candidatus Thermoplasmatota archaeon]